MNRLVSTSLALVLVSALGIAATGSAFAASGQSWTGTQSSQQWNGGSTSSQGYNAGMQNPHKIIRGYSGDLTGVVTLVGARRMNMIDPSTGVMHQVRISKAQERALTTGYNIDAQVSRGRLVSFRELGIPKNVQNVVYSAEGLPGGNMPHQIRG
jgi:hypothetical protein